ncbi:hypothetical protein [Yaravirus sp. 'brasiliensis']|uniref:Uncharacterized protein n=1 Tax=Yaravirus sp. 'brasiliensis' TaxID=2739681 RepID=A0AAE7E1Q5_9VIRU|nr:hypothetical protein QKS73_gp42 [Yaravirus brasiliensis]QKE44435.1 hypothetical protein [Yaravirus brasiliensis]
MENTKPQRPKQGYNKNYYEANKERILAAQRAYRERRKKAGLAPKPSTNPPNRAEYRKRYYEQNKQRLLDYQRAYYIKKKSQTLKDR